jgi:L-threonylcarbamoyladenylate synthase
MFFGLEDALAALPELPAVTAGALERLLPGGVTLLVPNPAGRFPLACADDPATLGVRVPALEGPLAPLAAARWPVLQSSANLAGQPAPRRLADVAEPVREGADLLLDAGELPGTPSTVVDLRRYAQDGEWTVVRPGAVATERLAEALSSPGP